jgi:multidrug efflux pump subunit AcrA (membrane-fusion protein)
MQPLEHDLPGSEIESGTIEERLRRENQELRRQLQNLKGPPHGDPHIGPPKKLWNPSSVTIWSIVLLALVAFVIAFFAGYLPLRKRNALNVSEMQQQEQALPRVEVVEVGRSARNSELELPGNIQAITEAPILARADGYLLRRMVDIGDRVRAGQPLAEIEAPELDEQMQQAKANLQQARAALDQALANYEQGKSNMEFAHTTADRWGRLAARGAVSRQENDQYQSRLERWRPICKHSKRPSPHSAARLRRQKPAWRASIRYRHIASSRRLSMESLPCAMWTSVRW